MNAAEAAALVRAAKRMWPHSFANESGGDMTEIAKTWQLVMVDVPYDDAVNVLVALCRTGVKFAPGPGEIVEAFHHTVDPDTPAADVAWAEMVTGVRNCSGGYHYGQPPAWSHPAVADAVAGITWRELCLGDEMTNRAHFLRMYPDIARRHERQRNAAHTAEAIARLTAPALGPGVIRSLEDGSL